MIIIPEEIFDAYMEDEYQNLIHLCQEELKKSEKDDKYQLVIQGLCQYAEASEEWEKSYNYGAIHSKFEKSIQLFSDLIRQLEGEERFLVEGFEALSKINDRAVEVENALVGNDPKKMSEIAFQAAKIGEKAISNFPEELEEDSQLSVMKETLVEYYHYQAGMAEYGEMVTLLRTNPSQFDVEFPSRVESLENHVSVLEEIGTDVTITEVNAFLQNINYLKLIRDKKTPAIIIENSSHVLSISFYTGGDYSNYVINSFSGEKSHIISEKLFSSNITIQSAGIDTLDDFLETAIGSEYADKLHLMLGEGQINLLGNNVLFTVDLYIRRFGVATVAITLDCEALTVSDLRTIQQLVGPQAGTNEIQWQERKFFRFDEICREIEDFLLRFHNEWKKTSQILPDFMMDKVPFEHERTWFARSILKNVLLKNPVTGELIRIYDYTVLKASEEFKGLVIPLFEGRSALDDWIQKPLLEWRNLAEIRGHCTDLIVQSRHSLTVFMPDDPNWIIDQILACGELVNDIATLIISFDVMAESVRSNLIHGVQDAKYALERVQMKKVNEMIDKIRKRSIEITEFELLALQSIQLLRDQGTLKYFDHANFMNTLIANINLEPVIQSLERKLAMVKESQKGIIRTADDLLLKYKDRVSESQGRLIKVVTLLIAGFAQISFLDNILGVLNTTFSFPEIYNTPVKSGVVIIVLVASGLALGWLGLNYLKSRRIVFEFDTKS